MYAIETQNLKKDFADGKEIVHAVKGIGLKIEKNQVYGLLGPNGAGKTTTIFMLSTLLLPTSGSARVLGFDVVKERNKIRDKIGLCLGGSRFYWDMKPAEILEYYGRLYGIKKEERRNRIKNLIDDLDMNWYADRHFSHMSTGMRQKVAVAKSLINNPEVLFLDEPTAGLDVEVAVSVRKYILKLAKEREMTVILTSHHLNEVEEMCKRISIINNGKIVSEGTLKEIRQNLKFPDIVHLYLSDYSKLDFLKKEKDVIDYKINDGLFIQAENGLKTANRIEKILKKKKVKTTDIEIRKASLEEVFLKIIGGKADSGIRTAAE